MTSTKHCEEMELMLNPSLVFNVILKGLDVVCTQRILSLKPMMVV